MVSYAQNFEDVMLWRALGHLKVGNYIDIGAQHPQVDSVSKVFAIAGWNGFHIEPVAQFANLLREDRPGDNVFPVMVGKQGDIRAFYEIKGTGLSTGQKVIATGHKKQQFDYQTIKVPSISLDKILSEATKERKEVHWLKIDVEGMEKEVLESWHPSKIRPWVVLVESIDPITQKTNHEQWESILLELEYQFVYFDGLNRFYVSKEQSDLKKHFQLPPNVFDGFTLSGMASSSFCVHLNDKIKQQKGEIEHLQAEQYQQKNVVEHLNQQVKEQTTTITEKKNQLEVAQEQLRIAKKENLDLIANNKDSEQKLRQQELSLIEYKTKLDVIQEQAAFTLQAVRNEANLYQQHRELELRLANKKLKRKSKVQKYRRKAVETQLAEIDFRAKVLQQNNELLTTKVHSLEKEQQHLQQYYQHLEAENKRLHQELSVQANTPPKVQVVEKNVFDQQLYQQLSQQIQTKDRQIKAVYDSISWKVTAPGRFFIDLFLEAKRVTSTGIVKMARGIGAFMRKRTPRIYRYITSSQKFSQRYEATLSNLSEKKQPISTILSPIPVASTADQIKPSEPQTATIFTNSVNIANEHDNLLQKLSSSTKKWKIKDRLDQ